MNFTESHKTRRSVVWKASLLFILVSALLIAADQLSIRWGLDGSQRIVDDLLGGLIAGLIFHFYERLRLRQSSERLQVIDLMNHHIRNALQPLMFVPDDSGGKAPLKMVEECVRRIDWALREVLSDGTERQSVVYTDGGAAGKNGLTVTSRATDLSSETERFWPIPTDSQSKPVSSHWLETWKDRSEAPRR